MNPTPTDRRFFLVRVEEAIDKGLIEKVYVPNEKGTGNNVCIRLVPEGAGKEVVDINHDQDRARMNEEIRDGALH